MADERIRLAIPADPEYGRVARVAAAGLALRIGFSYEEIEEIRLAIDETIILLLRPEGGPGRITLMFDPSEKGLAIDAFSSAGDDQAWVDSGAKKRFEVLVAPIVDAWEIDSDARIVHVLKHRSVD